MGGYHHRTPNLFNAARTGVVVNAILRVHHCDYTWLAHSSTSMLLLLLLLLMLMLLCASLIAIALRVALHGKRNRVNLN